MVIFSVWWEDALISLELLPVIPIFHEGEHFKEAKRNCSGLA
jgi:hypothetical protein